MVYTVTMNPSLDYIVKVEQFYEGHTNRSIEEKIVPGGKGINVSYVLKQLGIPNISYGFISGFTGKEIEAQCFEIGLKTEFIHVNNGFSRINVKIKASAETELNGKGPNITRENLKCLFRQIQNLTKDDYLVLSGNCAPDLPKTLYADILSVAAGIGCRTVVDTTGEQLTNSLSYHPYLIKPNREELSEIFHLKMKDTYDICIHMRKLQELGAQNVLVSCAGEGAVFLNSQGRYFKSRAAQVNLVNSVGSGDSMVAGFLYAKISGYEDEEALRWGIAAGSSSASSEWLPEKEQILSMYHILSREPAQ